MGGKKAYHRSFSAKLHLHKNTISSNGTSSSTIAIATLRRQLKSTAGIEGWLDGWVGRSVIQRQSSSQQHLPLIKVVAAAEAAATNVKGWLNYIPMLQQQKTNNIKNKMYAVSLYAGAGWLYLQYSIGEEMGFECASIAFSVEGGQLHPLRERQRIRGGRNSSRNIKSICKP